MIKTIIQLTRLAIRNIQRNIRRTLLSGSTIAIAAFVVCVMFAFEYGMIQDMENNIRNHVTGDIRVRNELFTLHERVQPLQYHIDETPLIISQIESFDFVEKALPSISTGVMIYRNEETANSRVIGLDFQQTNFFNGRNNWIIDGSIPEADLSKVLITEGFAQKTGLTTGDKFTFIVKTAAGGTNGITAQISGIIHIGDSDFNGNTFFIDWKTLSSLLRMNGNALEILITTKEGITNSQRNELLRSVQALDSKNLEVIPWSQVSLLVQMFQFVDIMFLFFALFFFLLACTVIFNTTMMSVLERKKEIGTLLALGLEAKTVSTLFLMESVIISAAASLTGILLGAAGITIMHTYGINLGAMGGNSMNGMNFSSWIYPNLNLGRYVLVFFTGIFTACAACIIPALLTLTVQPAEALRTEN
jgi:putative ABC transport system permease protein